MTIQQKAKPLRENWLQIDTLRCGMDWTEEDLERPQILVDDVFGHSHPGSFHLDSLSHEISKGIFQKGGKPSEFHVTDICDGWAMGHDGMNYILLSREIICEMVEVHAAVLPWDGIVLVSSCDKAIPAHLMAAARINAPVLHLPGGSARIGPDMTSSVKSGEMTSGYKQKQFSKEEMRSYILSCDPSCGACQFMGTASTMQCMSEALGMALPGSALVPATLQEIHRYARKAGQKIMELAEKGIRASDILTKEALLNAIRVDAATGGSTNALLHLPAIAHELNIEISYADFEEANAIVPYLTNIQPSGSFLTEFFWFSGGVPRVQWEIQDLLHLDVMTVTGKTLKENLEDLKREGFFERTEGWLRNYKVDRKEALICQRAGLPDRKVDAGRQERVAFVVRRFFPPGALQRDEDLPPFDGSTWFEHAFVAQADGTFAWQPVATPPAAANLLVPGEERLPLFPVNFTADDQRQRRVLAGLIPVGRREAYMGSLKKNGANLGASSTKSGNGFTGRKILFRTKVSEPWKALVDRAVAFAKATQKNATDFEEGPPASEFPAALQAFREQIQVSSWLILADFRLRARAADLDGLVTRIPHR